MVRILPFQGRGSVLLSIPERKSIHNLMLPVFDSRRLQYLQFILVFVFGKFGPVFLLFSSSYSSFVKRVDFIVNS